MTITVRQAEILEKVRAYNTYVAQSLHQNMLDREEHKEDYAMGYVYGVSRMLYEIDVITYEESEVLRGVAG